MLHDEVSEICGESHKRGRKSKYRRAGSGVILDPEKAKEELEPFSRMAGGMVKDALD